jgi:PhnB protein
MGRDPTASRDAAAVQRRGDEIRGMVQSSRRRTDIDQEEPVPVRLNPYISFRDQAREAMELYKSVFGGELEISTFGESGMSDDPAQADKVMHALLDTGTGMVLMASDTPPGMEHDPGTNVSISLSGDDSDELRGYWEKLSAGANVTVPLEKQMWGDEFGACIDRFGISWMVNIGSPQPS